MRRINLKHLPLPGLRNIKTSIAIMICLMIYHFMDRGGNGMLLAPIAALICMQDSVEKSIRDGVNRVIGTIIGGLFGILYANITIVHANVFVSYIICTVGVSVLIYIGILIHKKESIAIAVVVYMIIALDTSLEAPMIYSVNRVLDTIIGIVVAVIVNRFMFNPNERRLLKNKTGVDKPLEYTIRKAHQHRVSTWNGGTTTEIEIFPPDALYSERNFGWRISSATVNVGESQFTKLPGYKRHIMVLDGKMRLVHKDQHTVDLERFDQDFFSGGWDTTSFGVCTDFNIMLADGFSGSMRCISRKDIVTLDTSIMTAYYCLEDGVRVTVKHKDVAMMTEPLQKGDFIAFNKQAQRNAKLLVSFEKLDAEENEILTVQVQIATSSIE